MDSVYCLFPLLLFTLSFNLDSIALAIFSSLLVKESNFNRICDALMAINSDKIIDSFSAQTVGSHLQFQSDATGLDGRQNLMVSVMFLHRDNITLCALSTLLAVLSVCASDQDSYLTILGQLGPPILRVRNVICHDNTLTFAMPSHSKI